MFRSIPPRARRRVPAALALALCAYAALLRLEPIAARYGPFDHPAWLRAVTTHVAPLATHVRPASFQWARVPNPYAGGDPISYLRFAREMKSFYQAHVREPMFLALTRAWLWLTADQDVGISFASASASVAAVFATYLLGATAFSPPIGLFAALAFAIDWAVIDWSNGGWRDDLFACVVTFSAWAFVRVRRDPRARNAALLGVLLAAASLTRITALSFAIPALLWSIVDASRPERRARARAAAIAAVIAALLVAPYLVNCARAFGDPFIAIDVHTDYYLTAEGGPPGQSVGALTYIADKIRHRPVAAADTAVVGLFVRPLADKWSGLDFWIRGASVTLFWCAIAGLVLFAGSPNGRLLLVILFASLVPYAFTWNVGDGGAWRFTLHAYPLLLVAAGYAVRQALRGIAALRDRASLNAKLPAPLPIAVAMVVAVLVSVAAVRLPYFATREALAAGEETTIVAGPRDDVFFVDGWLDPHTDGAVTSRVAAGTTATLRLPVPVVRNYTLTLRVDPIGPDVPRSLGIVVNGRAVDQRRLSFDPNRVGAYDVFIPSTLIRRGSNTLQLVGDGTVASSAAGPRYAWIAPPRQIGFRFWYVRLHPA